MSPLRLLVIEDDAHDAELEIMALEEAGYTCQWERVETRADFLAAVTTKRYDVILADYNLPAFDGLTALKLLQAHQIDLPFILVSGKMGEEIAIESLKAGATDYILKQRLSRLGLAVKRALREKEEQRQRRQAEMSLRESELQLRSVLDSAVDGIIIIDDRGRIQSFNQAAEKDFGYRADEVIGQNVTMLMTAPDQDTHDEYMTRYRKTDEKHIIGIGREVIGRRKDGSTIPIELSVSEAYIGDRQIFTGILRDISERKQLEAQLLHSQKMEAVGRLASGVAHDFNNLLTVIMGYSGLLLANHPDKDDPLRRDIEQIRQATTQATLLTRQLLAFSRRQILQPQVLNLNEIVQNIDKMLGRLLGEDIELALALQPNLGSIKADPGQIEQVIMNLVINARDAMPDGGKLTIHTSHIDLNNPAAVSPLPLKPGHYILLTVADTGVGMDEETQARVFEPFYTTKAPGKGTGLGLSTAYGIIKQSNGHIAVSSGPDQGTTFSIYLPVVSRAAKTADTSSALERMTPGSETILLVEDDTMVRELVHLVLKKDGYTVLAASHGHEALRVNDAHNAPIHLLVADLVMPHGMNGRELAEHLMTLHPDMKVLYTSGYVDDDTIEQLQLREGVVFLPKPFAPTVLAQKVRDLLREEK